MAKDVCEALALANSRDAIEKLDADEKGVASTDTLGGRQEMQIISESGLYALILRCRDAMKPGTVLASSRTVAEAFRKRHDHTINAIDNLLISLTPENSGMLFREVLTEHPTVPGRMIRSFEMTRDGFTLLAMGFTGEKALRWKLKYIDAFASRGCGDWRGRGGAGVAGGHGST